MCLFDAFAGILGIRLIWAVDEVDREYRGWQTGTGPPYLCGENESDFQHFVTGDEEWKRFRADSGISPAVLANMSASTRGLQPSVAGANKGFRSTVID